MGETSRPAGAEPFAWLDGRRGRGRSCRELHRNLSARGARIPRSAGRVAGLPRAGCCRPSSNAMPGLRIGSSATPAASRSCTCEGRALGRPERPPQAEGLPHSCRFLAALALAGSSATRRSCRGSAPEEARRSGGLRGRRRPWPAPRRFLAALALAAVMLAAAPPQRIVSTAPAITETLFALGLGSRVVGVSSYCVHPPEAASRPKIGGYLRPDVEAIVALQAGPHHRAVLSRRSGAAARAHETAGPRNPRRRPRSGSRQHDAHRAARRARRNAPRGW